MLTVTDQKLHKSKKVIFIDITLTHVWLSDTLDLPQLYHQLRDWICPALVGSEDRSRQVVPLVARLDACTLSPRVCPTSSLQCACAIFYAVACDNNRSTSFLIRISFTQLSSRQTQNSPKIILLLFFGVVAFLGERGGVNPAVPAPDSNENPAVQLNQPSLLSSPKTLVCDMVIIQVMRWWVILLFL